jgi:hemolysin D
MPARFKPKPLEVDPLDFLTSPCCASLTRRPIRSVAKCCGCWPCCSAALLGLLGQLDIVAVAEGKLIPQSYLKIVQPAEAGIVKEILVREGETVSVPGRC